MKLISKRNTLLFLGAATLATGILGFAGQEIGKKGDEAFEPFEVESCGVERWSVKVLSDGDASSVNVVPVNTTIKDLVNLTTPKPDANMPRQSVEKQVYTVHCTVAKIKLESDGDYHLLLEDDLGNTMIGEIPDPTCPSTTSSIYFGDISNCRKFIDKHYSVGTSFQTINAKMVVTGVAFVDPPHGQSDAAPNNLEIHSILDIDFEPVHTNGIAESAISDKHLFVSPNPMTQHAVFRLGVADAPFKIQAALEIFDLQGREVRNLVWPAGQQDITLFRDNLRSGCYFYRLLEGNELVATGKIMMD